MGEFLLSHKRLKLSNVGEFSNLGTLLAHCETPEKEKASVRSNSKTPRKQKEMNGAPETELNDKGLYFTTLIQSNRIKPHEFLHERFC